MYGKPVPQSKFWNGLYIDDHVGVVVGTHTQFRAFQSYRKKQRRRAAGKPERTWNCEKLNVGLFETMNLGFDNAAVAYVDAGLEKAADKGFRNRDNFTVWGTEVQATGTVGAPLAKRFEIAFLGRDVLFSRNQISRCCSV